MKRVLITGAAGHVGRALLRQSNINKHDVLAGDIVIIKDLPEGVGFECFDICERESVDQIFEYFRPEVVVHLASVVTPPKNSDRNFAFDVDVNGTRHIMDACVKYKTDRLVVTSSGAAYGYHPENASPLGEDAPIRGNYEFPYSYHKRLVEEMLAEARNNHPALEQVVLRVGTVLGPGLENQITALFHKAVLPGIRHCESPFVFIWDDDLAQIVLHACEGGKPGIYNIAGDGALGLAQISRMLQKPLIRFPEWVLRAALTIAAPFGFLRYGPEQIRFLKYRPVLDNSRLKCEFGYTPTMTSLEAFQAWQKQARL